MNLSRFFAPLAVLTLLVAAVPSAAFAASGRPVCSDVTVASFRMDSLTTLATKPTLYGFATGTNKVIVTITKEGSTKALYKSNSVTVRDGVWKIKSSKKIPLGSYEISVSCAKHSDLNPLAESILTVGTNARGNGVFRVSPVLLLGGGVAHAGTSVPVSYLQITNTGKERAALAGFTVRQNGSASTKAIIGLTAVDDTGTLRGFVGGAEGSTPFVNGQAFVPMVAEFAPNQMRLFTIKAALTRSLAPYLGSQLQVSVVSLSAGGSVSGSFPISGTTWTLR